MSTPTSDDVIMLESSPHAVTHASDTLADRSTVDLTSDSVAIRVQSGVALFGTQTGLANYLDVARTQPGRWLKGAERPTPSTKRLVADLDYLWSVLTIEMGAESAGVWLRSSNPFLGGATPLDWLKQQGPSRVIDAFDAMEAGSYP